MADDRLKDSDANLDSNKDLRDANLDSNKDLRDANLDSNKDLCDPNDGKSIERLSVDHSTIADLPVETNSGLPENTNEGEPTEFAVPEATKKSEAEEKTSGISKLKCKHIASIILSK